MSAENPIATEKLVLLNKNALYKAYMPFLQNGGIFIATEKVFQLEETLQIELTLPAEVSSEVIMLEGLVVWITPHSAKNRWTKGVGIEFVSTEANRRLREKINQLLADQSSEAPTSTL